MKTLKRKPKDTYDNYLAYNTKFENVEDHEDFSGPKEIRHGEVEMVSTIGKMLSEKFGEDNILMQGRKIKKMN